MSRKSDNWGEKNMQHDQEPSRKGCYTGPHSHRAQHQVGKRPDQQRRVIQRRHHVELAHAQSLRFLASLDIDFVQRFDVLGEE